MFECPKCKSVLMPTKSGSVCFHGCMGLLEKMSRKEKAFAEAFHAGIPECRRVSYADVWTTNGEDRWSMVRSRGSHKADIPKGNRLALDGHQIVELAPKR